MAIFVTFTISPTSNRNAVLSYAFGTLACFTLAYAGSFLCNQNNEVSFENYHRNKNTRFERYHNKAWLRLFTCIFEGLFCLVPLVTAPLCSWLSETPDVLCCCPLVSVDLGDAPPTEGLLVEFSSYYLKNRYHVKWWN